MPHTCCCCPSWSTHQRTELPAQDAPSTSAKIIRFVIAFLSLGTVILGVLGAVALHNRLSSSMCARFKQMAASLQIDLISFAAIFVSTGAAGLFACYCLVPKKAGTALKESGDEADMPL